MPLRLYNTLTRRLEEFRPADPARITFYSCGPTVYDDAHIGNFRSFLAADVLRRWIESPLCELANDPAGKPRRVVHVMNITDVGHMTDDAEGGESGEDRMAVAGRRLLEAKKQGKVTGDVDPADPYQIARYFENRFKDDARKLGLKLVLDADRDPSLMPRATESVPGMIELVQRLIQRGNAYLTGRPGARVVYFRVRSYAPYGRLSGNTLDKLREGEGGRISTEHQAAKEHPADFLLWKEDPSHIMKWDSPWGPGYPGWHIECSVMSASRLRAAGPRPLSVAELASLTLPDGEPVIDLHSGGEDNIFPHHECEIAQSCCAFNAQPQEGSYASMWFHPRFLLVEGTKMSKSKGNFFTARDLFEGRNPAGQHFEPAAVRLELIKTHYRSNANFTMQGLVDSQRLVDRWRRISEASTPGTGDEARRRECAEAFTSAMHEDLNIAAAIAAVNSWAGAVPSPVAADAAFIRTLDDVLGVLSLERPASTQSDIGLFAPGVAPDPAVIAKLEERRAARAAKDFKKSDLIRDELLKMGYAIKDVAGGKVEVRRS
jgi:cysteinyl-tRNA synthetase